MKPILSSQSDTALSNLELSKFLLLRYIEYRIFNNTISDVIPPLLAEGLDIHLRIYVLDNHKIVNIQDFGNLENNVIVSLLFVCEKCHFLPLLNCGLSDVDQNAIADMVNKNSMPQDGLVDGLNQPDGFYQRVGHLFSES